MPQVKLSSRGDFNNTTKFLKYIQKFDIKSILDQYGQEGVEALRQATPKRTGLTSESWTYKVNISPYAASIEWWNTNENEGVPIALILQYGHGTGWGAYVPGKDYINPALRPIFDELEAKVWEVIQRA